MRRRYLIAYDIADAKRLRRICTIMEGHGDRLQYSVFVCDLSDMELSMWLALVHKTMNLSEDSVVYIDLGLADSPNRIRWLGARRKLPDADATIV